MPTRSEPFELPDTTSSKELPDTWSSKQKYPEDKLPLGRINLHAIDRVTLTLPSTVIDPRPPARPLTLLDARIAAMRATKPEAKDRAWRHLATLARTERGDWNLFALGMAYPGLRARITPFVKRKGLTWHQAAEVHRTMAIEFLFALHRLDLTRPYVLSRFLGAAYDHASRRKKRPEPVMVSLQRMSEAERHDLDRQVPYSDPSRVLAYLVRRTRHARDDSPRLTQRHATLVRRTYLAGETLNAVAEDLGMSQSNASKQRRRAVNLIAVLLGQPDLVQTTDKPPDGTTPQPPP